jgi:hypothetical protein
MVQLIRKYYAAILVIGLLLSIGGGYFSFKLTLDSDLAKLLPSDYESVKTIERIRDVVGGQGNIRIVLESPNFQKMKAFADTLADKFDANPEIDFVDYKNDVTFYKRNALLFLDQSELDSLKNAIADKIDFEKQRLNPFYVEDLFGDETEESSDVDFEKWQERYSDQEPKEYYLNADSTVLVMDVFPSGAATSLNSVKAMFERTRAAVEGLDPQKHDPDLQVYFGGNIKNRLDEYEVVKEDILGTAYYGFTGVFLLILIYFRRVTASVLITIALAMSISWTFGVAYLVIGSLNTITGFLFIILFGLGIDYGIHSLSRYAETRRDGATLDEALAIWVGPTRRALATSAFTTVAAFLSLLLMDFKGFSELGFISGVGIVFAFLAMVVVLPALVILSEKFHLLKFRSTPAKTNSRTPRPFPFAKPVVYAAVIMTIYSLYAVTHLEFEYDFSNLRIELPDRQAVSAKTGGIFDLSQSPAIVLADSQEEVEQVVAAVRKIIDGDTLNPTVKTVRSVYSFVAGEQNHKLETIAEIRRMVEEETEGILKGEDKERVEELKPYLQVDSPFTLDDVPEKIKRQFTDTKGDIGNFAFIYPSVALRDGRNAMAFRDDIGTIVTESGKVFHASSSNIIFADMLTIMLEEGKLAVALTLSVVFLIVLLDFRSFRETALVLNPLILGMLWTIGAMSLFGLKINFFNMVVLPSVIGIGVDHGVHLFHRYKEEGRGSLLHVLKNTGLAITMCTLTTMTGYSGLIMAHHPGLNSIGDLAVIGLSATFITAVVVLPAMLQLLEGKNGRREGEGVSSVKKSVKQK